ncbi:hypothetical protein HPP92_023798 [Vanilla planifolia]|uniref:sucrose-phosphate synthase n=1 Tax=Vanilla planifolia TaxID=51239 RepID=A0A835PII9_VANPL|nr:hypothetical protein HPP92_023798 [Vanilla planifolia]
MAGNDWINSYLDAILDAEPGINASKSSLLLRERGRFSPTRYFVEEVITGFDETDLYKSWVRATATRSPQERNTRMENMCWRIWNLARKKKQIEGEEAQRLSKRRLERERGRRDATADMSEDLSEGEKGDHVGELSSHGESIRGRMPRISSIDALDAWASQLKDKRLYIVLISIHGLIRGENMELGRDSDTGGQVKYVRELARALGAMPGVYRVDLLTRQISAPDVDWSYGEPTEMLTPRNSENLHEIGESSGAYIVRIPFGPRNKYISKELLWPYIQEFVDGALSHIMHMSKVLGEQIGGGQPVWPAAIHGHYADAGNSAALISGALNVPMVFTDQPRIEAEELALDASEIVVTSTRQEIEEQWCLYEGFDVILERKLRARIKRGVSCYGRFMPRMVVIPPGMEFHHIVAHDGDIDVDVDGNEDNPPSPDPPIWAEIMRFFTNPRKPMILALARPDPKKNILTLVKAFGELRPLRELANLTLIMGNRDAIDEMSGANAAVLVAVLKLIDKYDLYGQVAYPKHHRQSDVADIYRLAAKTKGVFINPAFIEPFGLTLIEAAAHGLPIVATKNGGPVDIIRVLDNGLLIDPHDQNSIADALYKLVSDKQLWARCRQNGLKNIHLFSWPEHCKTYLSRIASCRPRHPQWKRSDDGLDKSDTDSPGDSLRDIQDISLNLTLSLEGEKVAESGNLDTLDSEESVTDRKSKLEKAFSKFSKGVQKVTRKTRFGEKADQNSSNSKLPALRRRNHIFVIAVDCDEEKDLIEVIHKIFDAVHKERAGGIASSDFDAFVCNSGSDLYYPISNSEDTLNTSELPFELDLDYHSQIEYRWGGEGLRKTFVRWAASVVYRDGSNEEQAVLEDEERSSTYCYAFKVKNPELVPSVKELRKLMRIQALRCRVLYSHDGRKLHVVPILASRSQALRYLYVRWEINLSNMVVFVGESGDTDYEGLLGGVHKTVILKGSCDPPNPPVSIINYALEDVVAFNSPNILHTNQSFDSDEIVSSLQKLGLPMQ